MEENNKNLIYNIYGARVSKNKERLNVVLVTGEDKKEFANTLVKLDNSQQVKVLIKDGYAYLKIKMLSDKEPASEPKDEFKDLPF